MIMMPTSSTEKVRANRPSPDPDFWPCGQPWRQALAFLPSTGFVVFWSCGFIGARWGTEYSSAFDLLAWRYLVAGSLAALVLLKRRPQVTRRGLRRADRITGGRRHGRLCGRCATDPIP